MNMFFAQPTYVGVILTSALFCLEGLRREGVRPQDTEFGNVYDAYWNLFQEMRIEKDVIEAWSDLVFVKDEAERNVIIDMFADTSRNIAKAVEDCTVRDPMGVDNYMKLVHENFLDAESETFIEAVAKEREAIYSRESSRKSNEELVKKLEALLTDYPQMSPMASEPAE